MAAAVVLQGLVLLRCLACCPASLQVERKGFQIQWTEEDVHCASPTELPVSDYMIYLQYRLLALQFEDVWLCAIQVLSNMDVRKERAIEALMSRAEILNSLLRGFDRWKLKWKILPVKGVVG